MKTNNDYYYKPVDRNVFRAYDIRGLVELELDEHAFYTIGKAVSMRLHQIKRNDILVGRDGRLSSPKFLRALSQGLLDGGIRVVDLGEITTPMMYYATHVYEGVDSGLMVTGSHNPADYNGIKMVIAHTTLAQDDIQLLYQLVNHIVAHGSELVTQHTHAHCHSYAIDDHYTARILDDIQLQRNFKVVVDCGNGVAGPVVPHVLRELGCEVIELYCDVDGRFPNHHPDPTIEKNLVDLKKAIQDHQADIGLAFDGDADRLGVVTNQGELIWPDRLMMLYARELLKQHPGATIAYDVKCSSHLTDMIRSLGGIAKMCPTGHSIVKSMMKKMNAILAGEMSGHIFFKDRWYGFDDALYSACRLLEMLSASPLSVSEQFLSIPNSINTPEIKIPMPDTEKSKFMQRFVDEASFPEARIITLDGIRVEFPYGWGLLRASNTTPCLVARFEAVDHASLNEIQDLFKTQLRLINTDISIPF